jgi:hypothetical protein
VSHLRFSRALPVAFAVTLVSTVACADMPSSPAPILGTKATRDSIPPLEGDSTACRFGYVLIGGRVVCNTSG